ncbi:MAG TPA: DUF2911 domain-containing protein [Terriglobia bacterium]|nr:DUF2911 domain-containing protein [Terriglobia bacterium]
MKDSTRVVLGISAFAMLLVGPCLNLAHGNDQGQAKATVGRAHVSIEYGRPTLKGRDPMQMIQPGQMWRMGADSPTTIDSDQDLLFGNTRVPKGKHILLARLAEPGKWFLVVSTKSANQYEPGAKLAEVPMKLVKATDPREELTIKLSVRGKQGFIEVDWGGSRLIASFTAAP